MENTQTTRRTIGNRVLEVKKTLGVVVIALGLSYCGGRAAHAQTTTQEAEGNVEIWINNTEMQDDDVLPIGGSLPCQVHLKNAQKDMNVVLVVPPISTTNNSRRLGISMPGTPNNGDGSLSLTLAKDGTWQSFYIDGQIGSNNTNDAKIEAHKDTATGDIKTTGTASVYWFKNPIMKVTPGGAY